MIDEERYIIRDIRGEWCFKKSTNKNYDRAWAGKEGKLFGYHMWSLTKYNPPYEIMRYWIHIERM
jgi:hypothetical protein